ncbi:hypothetical protein AURANDRAFT_5571, partial [Aureococcus anophagefferens]
VYSWGRGRYGALGHDDNETNHMVPARIQGFKRNAIISRIACGRWHSVALANSRELVCWGRNHSGQLGLGFTRDSEAPTFAGITRHSNPVISCGIAHTLVLASSGQLLAWGCGAHGQLGYGDLWDREDPVVVPTVQSII